MDNRDKTATQIKILRAVHYCNDNNLPLIVKSKDSEEIHPSKSSYQFFDGLYVDVILKELQEMVDAGYVKKIKAGYYQIGNPMLSGIPLAQAILSIVRQNCVLGDEPTKTLSALLPQANIAEIGQCLQTMLNVGDVYEVRKGVYKCAGEEAKE